MRAYVQETAPDPFGHPYQRYKRLTQHIDLYLGE